MMFAAIPDLNELQRMTARFAPVKVQVNLDSLSPGDRKALAKLVEAGAVLDELFLTQMWSGNPRTLKALEADHSALGKARLSFFLLNKGPWSSLDGHAAFLPDAPPQKLPGANFYPEDMNKEEFEAWVKTLSAAEREKAQGFFTVVRRDQGKLKLVPYSREYRVQLAKLSSLLTEAAASTENPSLKRFLSARAKAFLSDDYYESDVAWMDLDAPLDITIGPYETYNDELFGFKASFEAFITLRDEAETNKVNFFASRLQEIENNLPIPPEYRNSKIGALAPIRVVNQVMTAGDAAHGVRTAAFNLPNDERVLREKGSKRVMLRNVQEAKFRTILTPIASRVLGSDAQKDVSFDWFFTHILAHELTHGIGPHEVKTGAPGRAPRKELKDLYSAIEEAKADVTGLFMLQYMLDRKLIPQADQNAERKLYTSFLASSFRTMRFGLNESHGKGMALQFNYLMRKGGFVRTADGHYAVDIPKLKQGVRELASELLTLEAEGDYPKAKRMLDELSVLPPELKSTLDQLKDLPTDINPEEISAAMLLRRGN